MVGLVISSSSVCRLGAPADEGCRGCSALGNSWGASFRRLTVAALRFASSSSERFDVNRCPRDYFVSFDVSARPRELRFRRDGHRERSPVAGRDHQRLSIVRYRLAIRRNGGLITCVFALHLFSCDCGTEWKSSPG